jgi:hypothetical protein
LTVGKRSPGVRPRRKEITDGNRYGLGNRIGTILEQRSEFALETVGTVVFSRAVASAERSPPSIIAIFPNIPPSSRRLRVISLPSLETALIRINRTRESDDRSAAGLREYEESVVKLPPDKPGTGPQAAGPGTAFVQNCTECSDCIVFDIVAGYLRRPGDST